MKNICIFCGGSANADPHHVALADRMGTAIAGRGWGVVYGGANSGLMGASARAALAAGGQVIGVLPDTLISREVALPGLSKMIRTASMTERKVVMTALSDGFVVLPGGFGTLDEMFEIITLSQLSIHDKPLVCVDGGSGFFEHLRSFFARAAQDGVIRPEHTALIRWASTPDEALDALRLE